MEVKEMESQLLRQSWRRPLKEEIFNQVLNGWEQTTVRRVGRASTLC